MGSSTGHRVLTESAFSQIPTVLHPTTTTIKMHAQPAQRSQQRLALIESYSTVAYPINGTVPEFVHLQSFRNLLQTAKP